MRLKRPAIVLLCGFAAVFSCAPLWGAPGTVDPLVAPRYETGGKASAIMVQPDGKWIVGGNFTTINGVARGKIARLHQDGSLDASFDPGPKASDPYDRTEIYTLSLQGEKVLAGGFISQLAGQPASAVVRLNADGTRDMTFAPPAFVDNNNDPAAWVALDRGDGKILVGGRFSTVGGQPRANLVRLSGDGSIDATFNPSVNGAVLAALAVNGDRWIVAGGFSTVSGQARVGVTRLLANGDLDPTFAQVPLVTGSVVESLEQQVDGKIVYTGRHGSSRFVGRALADGGADTGFTPAAVPGFFSDAVVLPDGDIIIDGPNGEIEDWNTFQLSRLQSSGALDTAILPSGLGVSYDLLARPDGSVAVAGQFSSFGSQLRYSIARVLPDGSVDPNFRPDATDPSAVHRIIPLGGGGWLVVGDFSGASDGVARASHYGVSRLTSSLSVDAGFTRPFSSMMTMNRAAAQDGQGRLLIGGTSNSSTSPRRIHRLGVNGVIDPAFSVQLANGNSVADLAVQADGFILAAGNISQANGSSQKNVIRLSPAGAVDRSFTPPATGVLSDLAIENGGRILIAGTTSLKRLQASGIPDSSFNQTLSVTGNFYVLAPLPGRRVLVAGDFTVLNGQAVGCIARLDSAGNPDPSFQPGTGANGAIRSLQVRSDNEIFIAGDFTSYNGQPRPGIAQLSPDGALRPVFDPGTGFNGRVSTLALTSDGNVLAGGAFTKAGGMDRAGFAKLEGAPFQTLPPAPGIPGNLKATPLSSQQMLVLWTDSQNESGYFLERREAGTGDWLALATLAAGTTSFHDDKVVPGTTYEYRVQAWNASGDAPLATAAPASLPGRNGLAGGIFPGGALDLWRNGDVTAVARQADGKVIIAGVFTHLNGIPCGRIVRLLADGNIDPTFVDATNRNWSVDALGVQSTGRIIVCGSESITALKPDGSPDEAFTPPTDFRSAVYALAVLSDDKLMVGGIFSGSRPSLARLHPNGTIDTTFAHAGLSGGLDGGVNALAIQPDGKVLASGSFTRAEFTFTTSVARFNTNGTRDTSFAAVTFKHSKPGFNAVGAAITLQGDGKILVAGEFSSVNNVPRSSLVRLEADGTVDASLVSGTAPDDSIRCVKVLPAGRLAIGGYFRSYGGTDRSCWAVIESTGALVSGNADIGAAYVRDALRMPDNRLLVIGNLWSAGGQPHLGIVRLEANGTAVDGSYVTHATRPGSVEVIHRQPDGRALVAGDFSCIGGPPPLGLFRPSIFRIQADGSIDPGFDAGSGFDYAPETVATGPGGRIFVGGAFRSVNGVERRRIAVLHPNGAVDVNFAPPGGADNTVFTILPEADGGATIGGGFATIAGQAQSKLARLDANGQPTSHYQGLAGPNESILTSMRCTDGSFWVGGAFSSMHGSSRPYLAKLLATGSPDASGVPSLNGNVSILEALPGSEGFFAGGNFTTASGIARARVARLTATGAVDPGFVPALATTASAPSTLAAMVPDELGRLYVAGTWAGSLPLRTLGLLRLLPNGSLDRSFDTGVVGANIRALGKIDGGLLVGGSFTEWDGQARYGLVRLAVQPSLVPPAAPEGFTAVGTEGGASLAWSAVAGANGLLIERRSQSMTWQPIATLGAAATSFIDTAVWPGSNWSYRLVAFNAAGSSPATSGIEVFLPGTFATWKDSWGIAAGTSPDDDADHDGIPLLIEYALGLSPAEASQTGLPVATLRSESLELSYRRARPDLVYTVEASTDLVFWSSAGVSQGTGTGLVRVASVPRGTGPVRFLRLTVTTR